MALKHFDEDTIAAISTPAGEGGIGVVRLSGASAIPIADKIFKASSQKSVLEQAHMTAQHGRIVAAASDKKQKTIDEVLVLVMRAPKSYTREDVVEISAHGGPAVLKAILELAVSKGARPAERGEFTKRAFLNGRLDLVQAEAVLDLIRAKTEIGREWATAQLEGAFSKKMQAVKQELLESLSHLEASIDFPDDYLTPDSLARLGRKLETAAQSLENLLAGARTGLLIKNGLKAVIAGRPNVGKSSLLNALCRSNRAIVTPLPGTTRDVVGEEIQVEGFPVHLSDTAGIHDTDHPIEKEGIERSKKEVTDADLVLYVLDASLPLNKEDEKLVRALSAQPKIIVLNKTDLPKKISPKEITSWLGPEDTLAECSCLSEKGTEALEKAIAGFIHRGKTPASAENHISSVRQKELLEKAHASLLRAKEACGEGLSPELIAVDVRAALAELGALFGEVYTDDILEVLFRQFCIGK